MMRVVQRSVNLSSTRNLQQILIVPSLNDKTDTLEVVILLAEDVAGSLWIILLSLSTSLSSSTSNLSPSTSQISLVFIIVQCKVALTPTGVYTNSSPPPGSSKYKSACSIYKRYENQHSTA